MEVRFRVRGLFPILSFLLGSGCPSVCGCLRCGICINHRDGCKHMIRYGMSQPDTRPSQRCSGLKTLLSDHERCQEEVERGSHDVSGPWIEVTIIPVDRLETVHLEESLWRGKTLVCGRRSWMCGDRILLCNGNITSVCSGVYGMSVRSIRHCLRMCRGSQLRVGLTASLDGHRMSVWSRRHCRRSRLNGSFGQMRSDTYNRIYRSHSG